MSARWSQLHDRTFVVALAVITAVGLARLVKAGPRDFVADPADITACYMSFVHAGVATCLYVPLFAMGTSRALAGLDFSARLVRRGSRRATLAGSVPGLLARSVLFSVSVVGCAVAALVLRSGNAYTSGAVVRLAALQTLFSTAFFLAEAFLVVDVQLAMGSNALGIAAAVVYGALDTLLMTLAPAGISTFWTGWMLLGMADPARPGLAVAGAARVAALVAATWFVACVLVARVDFMDGDGHDG